MEIGPNANQSGKVSKQRYFRFVLAFLTVIVGVFVLYAIGSWTVAVYKGRQIQNIAQFRGAIDEVRDFFTKLIRRDGFLKPVGQVQLGARPQDEMAAGIELPNAATKETAYLQGQPGEVQNGAQPGLNSESNSSESGVAKTDTRAIRDQGKNPVKETKVKKTASDEAALQLAGKATPASPSTVKAGDFKECHFATTQTLTRRNLIINEVAWMGSASSANDEWIELKMSGEGDLDLTNWQLVDKDKQIKINLSSLTKTKVVSGQFLLLERTDDNSAPNVKADLIYSGALSNTDEGLRLFDSQCNLIDEALASPNWQAGESTGARKTMERDKTGFAWHDSTIAGGTPRKENSEPVIASTAPVILSPTSQPRTSVASQEQKPSKILISEVQITGWVGKTDKDFIELYNPSDAVFNLKGYRLVKRTKTGASDTSIKSWIADAFVPAQGYYLWANSAYFDIAASPDVTTTAAIANDNGIAVRFGSEDTGQIIDSVAWGEAENVFVEGTSFSANPIASQSIQRKFEGDGYKDTGNNFSDFEIQNCPNPKTRLAPCANASSSSEAPSASFVSNNQASSSTTSSISSSTPTIAPGNQLLSANSSGVNHILISEIMPGAGTGRSDEEFVELYNPTDSQVDLSGSSLKRKSSVAATSTQTLVKEDNFQSKIIKPRSFLLVASPEYKSEPGPDIIYSSSYRLAYDDDAVLLYRNGNEIVDELDYSSIEGGKSSERRAWQNGSCISSSGDGELLGNGCDTDNIADFEIRSTPNPQNAESVAEPIL